MKQRYKSLLESIFNSIKGNKSVWNKSERDNIPFSRWDVPKKKDLNFKNIFYQFCISDPKMEYKFDVSIFRYKTFIKKYAIIIRILENKAWGNQVEIIGLDAGDGYQTELRNIFNLLKEKDDENFLKNEEEKVNKYVRDVTLSIDKSILRDEKLDEILK